MGEIGEFWRDVKEARKQQRAENPPRRRCWDWMVVCGTCHYAKNRSSFKVYRRVGRKVACGLVRGQQNFVAGVGTVELKVKTGPEKGAPIRTLVLENVLHIPDAVCNGFSMALYHSEHGGCTTGASKATDAQGHPLWCAQPYSEYCGLQKLVLAGNPQGESYLKDGQAYMLSMYLDGEEIKRIVS